MPTYYLDTSALLPRFLHGAKGHTWIESICQPTAYNVLAMAEISEVEISSALNQLVRGGTLKPKRRDAALALFWSQIESDQYTILPITSNIIWRAASLCNDYSLKGYDAVQLACALTYREDIRQLNIASIAAATILGEPTFLTEDNRLADAAKAQGFTVDSPLAHP